VKLRRTAAVLAVTAAVVGSSAACSTRRIDPDTTGSVPVEGTSWMRFCDGPNAFIWVPGHNGDADELEAVIYDHWACVTDRVPADGSTPDDGSNGIVEDDE
jgi:hypothetical protein